MTKTEIEDKVLAGESLACEKLQGANSRGPTSAEQTLRGLTSQGRISATRISPRISLTLHEQSPGLLP